MKRIWIYLFSLLLLAGCASQRDTHGSVSKESNIPDGSYSPVKTYDDNPVSDSGGWYGNLPNGLRPVLCLEGKLYRWTGMSKEIHQNTENEIYTIGDSSTHLPDGYSPIGEISSITEDVPTEHLQLRAAFDAEATFYTNPDTPEVVYALMTTDWFEDYYIRFVSDDLHNHGCIAWQGVQYKFDLSDSPTCEELPDGCEQIGTLQYIGIDRVPVNDLETNCPGDVHSKSLHGREVYAIPGDGSAIYIYEHHYWAQGDYPAWRICSPW